MILPKIDFPTYMTKLPLSKKTIKYRPMVQKDEKLLLMAKEGNDPTEMLDAIKQVCINCSLDPNIDLNKVPIIDLEFLFINLRANSVSNITKVAYIDSGDEQTRTFEIDLTKVKVVSPEGYVNEDIKVNDKVSISLRYPPAELYSDKEFLNSKGEGALLKLTTACVDKIKNDTKVIDVIKEEVSKEEIDTFLQSLPIPIYSKITEFITNLPHLEYKINYTNNQGLEREIVLSSLNDFFTFA